MIIDNEFDYMNRRLLVTITVSLTAGVIWYGLSNTHSGVAEATSQPVVTLKSNRADEVKSSTNVSPRFDTVVVSRRAAEMGAVLQKSEERAVVILSPAEVLHRAGEPNGREGESREIKRSLDSEEWDGQAYLLVEELELGRGIELTHVQVMEFLFGEQAGWSDNYYRWISDELMTGLREDLPETAYEDLMSLVTNTELNEAIRGYALQHVGHLADQGVNTEEAVESLWRLAQGEDYELKSTALVGLYQYAKLHPEVQAVEPVIELAGQLVESEDKNTRVTAEGIVLGSKG